MLLNEDGNTDSPILLNKANVEMSILRSHVGSRKYKYKIQQQFIKNGGSLAMRVGHKCWRIEMKIRGNIETGYDKGHGQAQSTTKERRFNESNSSMSTTNHRKNVRNILCGCGKKVIFLKSKTNKNYGKWF